MTDEELTLIEAENDKRYSHAKFKYVPELIAEVRRLREMFDITRHRMCDAMSIERSKSWSSLETLAVDREIRIAELEADLKALNRAYDKLQDRLVAGL